jgi:outer membrane protein
VNTVKTLLLAAALLFAGAAAQAQQKIGYVNSAKIFKELPEAQDAQNRIDGMKKQVQDELEKRQKAFQDKLEEYQKKESIMNESAKKAAQDELVRMQREFEQLRQEKLGENSELVKTSERLLEPLRAKVISAIERVAKDEKYNFVFDRTETVTVLLYGDQAHDLTFKVIDRLKRGSK